MSTPTEPPETDSASANSAWEEEETTHVGLLLGGYRPGAISDEDRAIAAFAVSKLDHANAVLASVESAARQVVAGVNVKLELTLADGTRWSVVVYKQLDGTLALTASEPIF